MWFSLETASRLYDAANIFLIIALVVGAVSTVLVVWMGNVKEEYLRRDIASAQEEAAKADERAATAHERAAKSELDVVWLRALVRRAGTRVIDFQKFAAGLKEVPKRTVEIWYKPDDVEVDRFSEDLYRALKIGEWPVSRRVLKAEDKLGGIPLANVQGIMVFSHNLEDVYDATGVKNFMSTIIGALPFSGQGAGTTAPELPDDKVVVVIGTSDKL